MAWFEIGDKVRYHPVVGCPDDGKVYEIHNRGNIPSSEGVVYWLKKKSGCVSEESLSLVEGKKEA